MISDGLHQRDKWYNSLRLRMMIMMSLALLPIGMIAVTQTKTVSNAARESAQLSLSLMTEQAAFQERLGIERAMAISQLMALRAPDLLQDTDACFDELSNIITANPRFSNATITPTNGMTTCSSVRGSFDFADLPSFQNLINTDGPAIAVDAQAPLSGTSVVIVSSPFEINGANAGIATVSIPHSTFNLPEDDFVRQGLINLITLRRDGHMITASTGIVESARDMPRNLSEREFLEGSSNTFYATSVDGRELLYALVPIRGSALSVLGIWSPDAKLNLQAAGRVPPSLFPALMWIISLGVALFAVHRLVTRHIRLLGRQMAHFAANRRAVKAISTVEMPTELRDIQFSFLQMAESILQDEARLEDSVREKNVLLKEIHHRVKNNLQLISSIVNMQIRGTPDKDTKAILRRIQDRVLSLATIHRDLYQSSDNGRVNVGALVKEVIEKSIDIGVETQSDIDLTMDISNVHLFPDQAVPLSLLAAEAATNAMKYLGASDGKRPYVNAALSRDNDGRCDFIFENSIGEVTDAESTGLGAQLIKAFSIQLGAKLEVEHTSDVYRMHITFNAVDFMPDATDF